MKLPKRLSSRNFYSAVPFALSMILLYSSVPHALYLLPLAVAAVWSYFFGIMYFVAASFLLIYHRVGGVLGVLIVALVFLGAVMSKLDQEKAPLSDYAAVTIAIMLSVPTYYLLLSLSYVLSGFEATLLAVALFATLYFFVKAVAGD